MLKNNTQFLRVNTKLEILMFVIMFSMFINRHKMYVAGLLV